MGTSFQPLLRQVGGNGAGRSHPFLGDNMTPVNKDWSNEDGTHEGGVSFAPGLCISWQRGSLVVDIPPRPEGARIPLTLR